MKSVEKQKKKETDHKINRMDHDMDSSTGLSLNVLFVFKKSKIVKNVETNKEENQQYIILIGVNSFHYFAFENMILNPRDERTLELVCTNLFF